MKLSKAHYQKLDLKYINHHSCLLDSSIRYQINPLKHIIQTVDTINLILNEKFYSVMSDNTKKIKRILQF